MWCRFGDWIWMIWFVIEFWVGFLGMVMWDFVFFICWLLLIVVIIEFDEYGLVIVMNSGERVGDEVEERRDSKGGYVW